jgi:hypothetical protein
MIQAFYQAKPEPDTPYRQLSLEYDNGDGWRVLVVGGTKWGAKGMVVMNKVFDEGKVEFDKLYRQMQESRWKPYTPYQTWE